MHGRHHIGYLSLLLLFVFGGALSLATPLAGTSSAQAAKSASLQDAFTAAAREFSVPENVLLAVSYNLSRWETHNGAPSFAGGYGPMHLTDVASVQPVDGKGDGAARSPQIDPNDPAANTLRTAAGLLALPPDVLKRDAAQNIRGGAALLAQYARDTAGTLPASPADWYGAVAKYSGSTETDVALGFADAVYATIQQGASRTTNDGEKVTLRAAIVKPNASTAGALHLLDHKHTGADCPARLACRFIPAAYHQNDPNDASNYGNYDLARREADGLDIQYIVIHDTEGSYSSAIKTFQDPLSFVSAHYVLRSSDGQVTQMVDNKNVAYQAGNYYVNMHSIGIEHEGIAIEGATWYTEQMYRASATLVRYLADKYGVPLDRAHIIGHDDVPGPTPFFQTNMHWDPGPFWDWTHYMELLGAPIGASTGPSSIITIKPDFATNTPPLSYCFSATDCRNLPPQAANFVYLYAAPSFDAPLLDDPALPGPGTTLAPDWGDKAVTGQQFYHAESQGDWDAIYYGGQEAWFYNPGHANSVPGSGMLVTPKAGKASIPVYGRAYPEASAFPPGIPAPRIVPLQYTLPYGQFYVTKGQVKADFYNAPVFTLNASDNTVVEGQTTYYLIFFNHRLAFVQAGDVDVVAPQ
jgi:N-acetyl-anhydromuramyl-L-alanine amidase AmpD